MRYGHCVILKRKKQSKVKKGEGDRSSGEREKIGGTDKWENEFFSSF